MVGANAKSQSTTIYLFAVLRVLYISGVAHPVVDVNLLYSAQHHLQRSESISHVATRATHLVVSYRKL